MGRTIIRTPVKSGFSTGRFQRGFWPGVIVRAGLYARVSTHDQPTLGGVGLVGQMKATTAGPEFEKAMQPILAAAGPLHHGRLHLNVGASSHSSRRKKPYSGRIRCACDNCGYTVHTTQMAESGRSTPLPKARSNGSREDASFNDRLATFRRLINSCAVLKLQPSD